MSERFLERVSVSTYRNNFILKGGMLVASIVGVAQRSTMDVDATIAHYAFTQQNALEMVKEIANINIDDDANFIVNDIKEIREDVGYSSYRVSLVGQIEELKVPLKLDLTSGDVITPNEKEYDYPLLLEDRTISIYSYPIETVLAEKYESILTRANRNTRMKDFYDVYSFVALKKSDIDFELLARSLRATATHRGTISNLDVQIEIVESLSNSNEMANLWKNYQENDTYASEISWEDVIRSLNILTFLISEKE